MKKNNSKKWIKTITITTAVLVFAAGAVFALKSAGTANTDKDSADTVVAAANEATDLVVKETVSEKESNIRRGRELSTYFLPPFLKKKQKIV